MKTLTLNFSDLPSGIYLIEYKTENFQIMKKWVVLLLFFGTFSLWSQDRTEKLLLGIIAADDALLSGIEVVNLGNEKVTVTNSKGEFFILAKADDILVFSSKSLEMRRVLIDEDDLNDGNNKFKMICN